MTAPRCICGCGHRAVHRHHACYEQHVQREGGDPLDARNLVPMAMRCHFDHHARARVLPLSVLPDSVFEFARETFGAGAAFVYLARMYAGDDPRLDALLENEEAA